MDTCELSIFKLSRSRRHAYNAIFLSLCYLFSYGTNVCNIFLLNNVKHVF
jgi:hypothetical protein